MSQVYFQEDFSYVHHEYFGDLARSASRHLLKLLRESNRSSGKIIDLGCGTGILTECLAQNGYDVVGVDYSPEIIKIAREKATNTQFVVQSIYDYEIPPCTAITGVGEVLNYYVDEAHKLTRLRTLFEKSYRALENGGVLLFDILEEGERLGPDNPKNRIIEMENWVTFIEREEDLQKATFTRNITLFRKVNSLYRKSKEVHRLQLYNREDIFNLLTSIGFTVSIIKEYNGYKFWDMHIGFTATKR